ncbi:Efflux pump roqT [Fusarium oxysporum f. sp. albedinis]|nr:Efflux pump roqT [Fusarium oxysporum f. sp. albedinis]
MTSFYEKSYDNAVRSDEPRILKLWCALLYVMSLSNTSPTPSKNGFFLFLREETSLIKNLPCLGCFSVNCEILGDPVPGIIHLRTAERRGSGLSNDILIVRIDQDLMELWLNAVMLFGVEEVDCAAIRDYANRRVTSFLASLLWGLEVTLYFPCQPTLFSHGGPVSRPYPSSGDMSTHHPLRA